MIAEFAQAHIASGWQTEERNGPVDRNVLRYDLLPIKSHKRDAMLIRLLRCRQWKKGARIAHSVAADGLRLVQMAERDVARIRWEDIMWHGVLTADQDSALCALRLDTTGNV